MKCNQTLILCWYRINHNNTSFSIELCARHSHPSIQPQQQLSLTTCNQQYSKIKLLSGMKLLERRWDTSCTMQGGFIYRTYERTHLGCSKYFRAELRISCFINCTILHKCYSNSRYIYIYFTITLNLPDDLIGTFEVYCKRYAGGLL